MTLVIDASALVAVLAERDADGRWAAAVVNGETLVAPHMLLAEASNTLRRLEQRGNLSAAQAAQAHQQLPQRAVALFPFSPFAERVWELRHNLTAYDAWYVALAEALDCPLVTLDARLSRAPGVACSFVTPPGEDG